MARRHLRIMFVAKHAKWQGHLHARDGNHAIYHAEMRDTLGSLGVQLAVEDSYEALFERPEVDFVFPLLNRGGFLNSEMLLPLLCTRHGIPFLGASPILRGLSDDKHLMKLAAKSRGIPTLPWAIYRRGPPVRQQDCPQAERFVVKPNASSASWGVADACGWPSVRAEVLRIHAEGHDAIVEPFLNGNDVEVSVITVNGEPVLLPVMMNRQQDPTDLRTYEEKRDLAGSGGKYELVTFDEERWRQPIADFTRRIVDELMPFDYGRVEFRLDEQAGQLHFMEVNLSCNLWSEKTISRAARLAGLSHRDLIETILCESLHRHRLLPVEAARAA